MERVDRTASADEKVKFYTDAFKSDVPLQKDNHHYLYAVVRKDLNMPTGKLAAQAGHAYTDALSLSADIHPERAASYRNMATGGSKVTMQAKNASALIKAYEQLQDENVPCVLIVDQHHILPPHFNGDPVITALGIGPCRQEEVKHITKRFQCV